MPGTNVVMSNNDADDTETEEKIAQILSEAKVAMQMKSGSSLVRFLDVSVVVWLKW